MKNQTDNINEHPDYKRLTKAIETLCEHFDSIHIFATTHDRDGTDADVSTSQYSIGKGNWFARYGQIKQWTLGEDEATRDRVRRACEEAAESEEERD